MNPLSLLPPPELLLPFLAAGIALNLTPGSDMTFVALSGARGGRRSGLAAAAGIFAGCLGHILLAVVGLSALIAASQVAFAAVKWLGVAYLLYLAFQLFRERGGAGDADDGAGHGDGSSASYGALLAFRQAALVNLMNPKVGIFFLAFLPQFVEPGAASPALQILALGLLFNATGLIVNAVVGLSSAAAARRLGGKRWLGQAARWLAGTVIAGLAVKLALTRND